MVVTAGNQGRRRRAGKLSPRPPHVAVVGAGPVGLTAALLMRAAGYRVTLIGPRGRADERTSALLAGSIALLERLGVWPALAREAAPLRSLRLVDGTQRLIRAPEVAFHASEIGLPAFGYNLPNKALVTALEAAITTAGIDWVDDSVVGLNPAPSTTALSLAAKDEIVAHLVVAADGRTSTVRDAAGIAVARWRYDQSALVCNLGHALPHNHTSTEFHTEAGPLTLVPLPGRRSSLVWVDRPPAVERRLGCAETELAVEIEQQASSILGAVTVDGPRQAFPLSGMTAERFAADRVILVGEAAHVFPPIGAQGLNLGYRDLAALEGALAGPRADPGDPEVLAGYDRERRADVVSRTAAVDALNRTLLSDFLPVQGLRGLGLFLLDHLPPLRRLVMRQGIAAR